MSEVAGSVVFSAREFVRYWFNAQLGTVKSISADPNSFGAVFLDYEEVLRQYFFQRPDLKKVKGLSKDSLTFAFQEYLAICMEQSLRKHIGAFTCTGETLEPIRAWMNAVTGHVSETDVAVIAQWLWLVKRKGFGLKARYHIMPVLFGPQGAGKSEAIKALFAPMAEFQMNLLMQEIGDSRQFEALSKNLIVFYDELSGIQRTDLNALKNQITTDYNSYRKLNTHVMVTVPMSCSFIAATNKHLDEQFVDSTGARRFYEIQASGTMDWAAINSLDYNAMWLGIDEQNATGYLTGEMLIKVTTAQQDLITAEDIEAYLDDRNYKGNERVITARAAYQDYRMWAAEQGIERPLNFQWFVKKVKNRGVTTTVERDANKTKHRFFKVGTDCNVGVNKSVATATPLKWSN